jgi:hypothetical protein
MEPKPDTNSAIEKLIVHHSSISYRPEEHLENVVNANGKYLGPYIPYIGGRYFNFKPRLLIYAMAQNLNRAEKLMLLWLQKEDQGLERLYYDISRIHVHPWDTGHLKVVAALALASYPGTQYENTDNINEVVAVTNFVKFSFYKQCENGKRNDINPPKSIYDEMWKLYCRYEIELMEPDIIIGVGKYVATAIRTNLIRDGRSPDILIEIDFPGRRNLNTKFIPKGKELEQKSNYNAMADKTYFSELLKGTPDTKRSIGKAINTDWYYFRHIRSLFAEKWR